MTDRESLVVRADGFRGYIVLIQKNYRDHRLPRIAGAKTGFDGSRVTTPYIARSTSYHVKLSQPLEGGRLS